MNNVRGVRYGFVLLLLLIAMLALVARMVQLGVFQKAFLRHQSQLRVLRIIKTPAHRGMIVDRNGRPLAVSTPVDAVWVNPKLVYATAEQVHELAQALGMPVSQIQKRLKTPHRSFVYLRRHVPPPAADRIRQLAIPGVFFQHEYRRYYPGAETTAHLLGVTNIDDRGQEGLELAYDHWLSGAPGSKKVLKDRLGHIIANLNVIKPSQEGHDLQLSIDSRIQSLAYEALQVGVRQFNGKSGSVVVLNPQTGEVLAMVNVPSYNPNKLRRSLDSRYRNRAVTDIFEPGSTMKAFSLASALQTGRYHPDTKINTGRGWMKLGHNIIADEGVYGLITLSQVLQKSSNVGVAKITLSLPGRYLWNLLDQLGFGHQTAIGFPGESSGWLIKPKIWHPVSLASLSFGYGVAVTTLQLAQAYAVLASGGIKRSVTLIKLQQPNEGHRVISHSVAKAMVNMLESVLRRQGTGRKARVPGYKVAGKTGTAYIAGKQGYKKSRHYVASFVGFAPVKDPQLVVAVVIKDPKGEAHFGGQVAAPVFSEIMSGALRILQIRPSHHELTNTT